MKKKSLLCFQSIICEDFCSLNLFLGDPGSTGFPKPFSTPLLILHFSMKIFLFSLSSVCVCVCVRGVCVGGLFCLFFKQKYIVIFDISLFKNN